MTDINNRLLDRIDELTLSERIQQWKQAVKSSAWKLFADREKWTVASWLETGGVATTMVHPNKESRSKHPIKPHL